MYQEQRLEKILELLEERKQLFQGLKRYHPSRLRSP